MATKDKKNESKDEQPQEEPQRREEEPVRRNGASKRKTAPPSETTVASGEVPVNPQDGQPTIAHVKEGEDGGDPYNVQSGYLPDPGPQGLPHLPPAGQEKAGPPEDSYGPGTEAYDAGVTLETADTRHSSAVKNSPAKDESEQDVKTDEEVRGTATEESAKKDKE
jgi:hypothetical protein